VVKLSDGKEVTLNIANYSHYRASKNPADRKLVMNSFWDQHARFENTFAALLDGKMKQHLYNARAYKYKDCLESRLFSEDISPEVYHQLIKSVRDGLPLLHRYISLKKQLLKLDTYRYDDIYASAVQSVEKKYTWDEACDLVRSSTKILGPEYARALDASLTEGWIDVYPNKGKESGAYSSGVYGVHPYVKMNYNGDYNAVSTLAHELGHAMHSYFSNLTQPYATADYATFLAEIASTFNENLLMHQMLKEEKDDLFKLYILDNYLEQVRGTIFRQTLFAEFELAMHEKVEQGQTLTPDWLSEKYLRLTREYYGADKGVMEVGDYIGNEWSFIPHFYMNYYVFQYSTGLIASMALSEKVLNGSPADRDRYLELLSAGGKDFPLNLLRKAGVDMTSPEPAKAAMKNFESLLGEMEKIVASLKAQGKI
jgi:oligoendopeptidase F